MSTDTHIYQLILQTGSKFTVTTIQKFQFERLSNLGYRTDKQVVPRCATKNNWITHDVYITAKPANTDRTPPIGVTLTAGD